MGLPRQEANAQDAPVPVGDSSQMEVALYIGRLTTDLRRLATEAHLDFLAYLLGMAEEEARLLGDRRNRPGR